MYTVLAEDNFSTWNARFQDFQCNCEMDVHFQLLMTPMDQKKSLYVFQTALAIKAYKDPQFVNFLRQKSKK